MSGVGETGVSLARPEPVGAMMLTGELMCSSTRPVPSGATGVAWAMVWLLVLGTGVTEWFGGPPWIPDMNCPKSLVVVDSSPLLFLGTMEAKTGRVLKMISSDTEHGRRKQATS